MKKSLDQYNDAHDGVKKTWDIMQSDFKCCGVNNSTDWTGKGSFSAGKLKWYTQCHQRVRNREEKTQTFFYLGQTVRADTFGRIYLGSQKSSQMAAYVHKSKNKDSSLNVNNLLSNKYPISKFDLTEWLIAIVFTYFFKGWVYYSWIYLQFIHSFVK